MVHFSVVLSIIPTILRTDDTFSEPSKVFSLITCFQKGNAFSFAKWCKDFPIGIPTTVSMNIHDNTKYESDNHQPNTINQTKLNKPILFPNFFFYYYIK